MKILLVSAGIFHPSLLGRLRLHRELHKLPGYHYQRVASVEALPNTDLSAFQSLVLHYHHADISPAALEALDRFVSQGGGILALHAATASFKETPAYFDILGGRFSGHGPVETFRMYPNTPDEGIFKNIPAFSLTDELYLHELSDDIEVHFYTEYEGDPVPMVWTRTYGEGRVCYASPGHTNSTMRIPAYLEILRRGLMWTCCPDPRSDQDTQPEPQV